MPMVGVDAEVGANIKMNVISKVLKYNLEEGKGKKADSGDTLWCCNSYDLSCALCNNNCLRWVSFVGLAWCHLLSLLLLYVLWQSLTMMP